MLAKPLRYVLNGLIATAVHYSVLLFNVEVLLLSSVGIANFIAALFGITTSFLGSRYFVFQSNSDAIVIQAIKFSTLYGAIALLHGFFLLVWSDNLLLGYREGFLLATSLQISIGYMGSKYLVFKKKFYASPK